MGLKQGKALDIDGLSVEHLQYCHPIVFVICFHLTLYIPVWKKLHVIVCLCHPCLLGR